MKIPFLHKYIYIHAIICYASQIVQHCLKGHRGIAIRILEKVATRYFVTLGWWQEDLRLYCIEPGRLELEESVLPVLWHHTEVVDSPAKDPFRFSLDDERVAVRRELDRRAVTNTMKNGRGGLVILHATTVVRMEDTRETEVANENTACNHGYDLRVCLWCMRGGISLPLPPPPPQAVNGRTLSLHIPYPNPNSDPRTMCAMTNSRRV